MEDYVAADSIRSLADYMGRYYGKKPLILLDEYDTPMQEAYINGYWDEIVKFFRFCLTQPLRPTPISTEPSSPASRGSAKKVFFLI